MSPPHMIDTDSPPTLPYRNGSPHKGVITSDDRFLADSSGHSSSGHGGRRNVHGSPTKPSRTTSERGGGRRAGTTPATSTGPAKPSTSFARQTRDDLQQQILQAQEKLKLVDELDRMTTAEKIDCLFQLIDGDSSGTVDAQELAAILRLRNANLTERESLDRAANMVSAFDADGNAELDQDEFKTFISTMLDQLQLDPDEFVEFLIFHIAFPDATSKDDAAASQQHPKQPLASTTGSPRRSAAATKTVPTRSRRPSPRPSVSSSCSGSTIATANETILTASSLSTSASASIPIAAAETSPSNQQRQATTRSGNHNHHHQQRAVVSIPKRVRNVGSAAGGGDTSRRRASTNVRRAFAPGHSSP